MMNAFLIKIKVAITLLLSFTAQLLGGFDVFLKSLLICMALDYITGILCALYEKKLNSKTGFKGIIKKAVILMIVAIASVTSDALAIESIRNMVISFYIANECLSVMENATKMNVPVFSRLKDVLEQLKNKK